MEPGTRNSTVGRYVVGFFVLLLAVVLAAAWFKQHRGAAGEGIRAGSGAEDAAHGR